MSLVKMLKVAIRFLYKVIRVLEKAVLILTGQSKIQVRLG